MKNLLQMLSRALSTEAEREAQTPAPKADAQVKPEAQAARQPGATVNATPQPAVKPVQQEPLIGRAHTPAEADAFMRSQRQVNSGGAGRLLAEAQGHKDGSAIKAFVPVFLREAFSPEADVQVLAQRGSEVLAFTNPDLGQLGSLNTVGYGVQVLLDEHDTASALIFRVGMQDVEDLEYPLYPSMILELGDTEEYLLVYRLSEKIDREVHQNLWRIKGILSEVMGKYLHGDIVRGDRIPMPGYFIRGSKRPVRVLRYGRKYSLAQLIHAFNADEVIQRTVKANPQPAAPAASQGTESGVARNNVALLNKVITDLSVAIVGPITLFSDPYAFARTVALKLREAGLNDEHRHQLAPELHAALQALEPEWVSKGNTTEEGIAQVLKNPDAVTNPTPTKSRTNTRKKATQA